MEMETESERGNGYEENDVMMGLGKRNIDPFQKHIKCKMLTSLRVRKNITRYQRFLMILH